MNAMNKWIISAMVALAGALPLTAQTVKAGTFDKTSIVVAFYRSPLWTETMKRKHAEMDEAKKANDGNRIAALEKWGESTQETAHRQLAGEAPLSNILEELQPAFAEIAGKAHVSLIAPDLAFVDKTVETVDVTSLLLDWLKADEQTRKIISGMRQSGKHIH
jgi:hypothetical protein